MWSRGQILLLKLKTQLLYILVISDDLIFYYGLNGVNRYQVSTWKELFIQVDAVIEDPRNYKNILFLPDIDELFGLDGSIRRDLKNHLDQFILFNRGNVNSWDAIELIQEETSTYGVMSSFSSLTEKKDIAMSFFTLEQAIRHIYPYKYFCDKQYR